MLGPVFQLDGDSCTPEANAGHHLRPRLAAHAQSWTSQWDLLAGRGARRAGRDITRRLALIEAAVSDPAASILIGRSSGARVATLLAARRPLRAVICLAYPFRHPRQPPEPARYAHLADLRTPTLILQGTRDPYGGREVAQTYALSPAITLCFLRACHKFELTPEGWDRVAARILAFCAALPPLPAGGEGSAGLAPSPPSGAWSAPSCPAARC